MKEKWCFLRGVITGTGRQVEAHSLECDDFCAAWDSNYRGCVFVRLANAMADKAEAGVYHARFPQGAPPPEVNR
jgi:hypothetical protein